MKAKYCKCLNTYTIDKCDRTKCNAPYYWEQGIGSTITENPSTIDKDIASNNVQEQHKSSVSNPSTITKKFVND